MIPKLQFSCPEDWNKMKIGVLSRHCESCNKEVFDFTNMKREDILLYLLENRDKKICGKILPHQVDYSHRELVITIESLLKKHKNSNLAFYLLTLGSLTLLSCTKTTTSDNRIFDSSLDSLIQINATPETKIDNVRGQEIITEKTIPIKDISITQETATLGMVLVAEDSIIETPFEPSDLSLYEPYTIAEVMPVFPGGLDSMVAFIKRNAIYPPQESYDGTTFVSVVIDREGKVTNPTIIKSLSENFDKEALRVISMMPNWIPGQNNGRPVAVRYVFPIKFNR